MPYVLVFLIAASVAVGASLHYQSRSVTVQGRNDREEPTPIREGEKTEKQRQHGKLFKHSGPKLRDLAANQNGDVEVEVGLGLMMRIPDSTPKPPVFQSALCNADAVVVGIINHKSAQLTEAENFVFTDYEVAIEEVIKNNAAAPIPVASTITTTRDGGAVQLNNRTFRAKRGDFDAPTVGRRFLLFLRFIPATGSYLMYGNGTFEFAGEKIIALGPDANNELANDATNVSTTFLNRIRSFANVGCQPR